MKAFFVYILFFIILAFPGFAMAEQETFYVPLEITDVEMEAVSDEEQSAKMFFSITSHKTQDDVLLKASAAVSDTITLCEEKETLLIPATQKVEKACLVFSSLLNPLRSGDVFPLSLVFEKEGPFEILVKVGAVEPFVDESMEKGVEKVVDQTEDSVNEASETGQQESKM